MAVAPGSVSGFDGGDQPAGRGDVLCRQGGGWQRLRHGAGRSERTLGGDRQLSRGKRRRVSNVICSGVRSATLPARTGVMPARDQVPTQVALAAALSH